MPKVLSSYVALEDVYEPLEVGLIGEAEASVVVAFDFGDGGARAMRMTGAAAASSGCRKGLCEASSKA